MNPQRSAQVLGVFQTVVIAGWTVVWLAGVGPDGIQNTSAAWVEEPRQPNLVSAAELVAASRATAVARADEVTAAQWLAEMATDPIASPIAPSDKPKPLVEASLADSSQMPEPTAPPVQMALASVPDPAPVATADEPKPIVEMAPAAPPPSPEPAPVQVATASTPDPVPTDPIKAASSLETPDACTEGDVCVDRYLWALYQRTPKEDSIKISEQRQVTVKRKGKTVTVTRSFIRLEDEDFAWKDPKAAERAGMPIMDYVVGGMDGSFKLKLFHLLRAAEQAGLAPGITSAFRDDYRQSIASGLKAASDRSYHGGSSHGGYGHGLAADIVSIKGETRDQRYVSSEALWKWVDTHGEEFGIGRPYLDRDPPHVAPIDGKEYASHRGTKTQHATVAAKQRNRVAGQGDHNAAKLPKTARSSKVRTS
ncbi:MAG TPA: peptidase M15 [Bradyrhizobium sp.]|nr:peptidase M15 [Bradyrhizobium sp.]